MNLIDYNVVIEALDKERQFLLNREQYGAENVLGHAISVIAELPIVRQPEIIRCKDCKHIQSDGWCKYYRHSGNEDWYCADGERLEKFDDLKGSEDGMKIKEIASKYGVSYNVAYLATYGVDPVTDAMKGREYNEQEIVANMRALILDRIDKHEKKITELREMLGGIESAE